MREKENKVIYQIYPKSFLDTTASGVGDINGIIEKLDYLKELGVDYLWLSPCCESPQCDNGYDISNYLKIDPMFGTNEDYLRLIKEANLRDINIMMDLVLNHTSDKHEWFLRALSGEKKYQDYYIWADKPNELTSFFGGTAWSYSEEVGKYYFHLFDKGQPDLNWANPEVRAEIHSIVNSWIDAGVMGFRLDVIDLIGKEPEKLITGKGPRFLEYLEELSQKTFGSDILTVGECWGSSLQEMGDMCNERALTQAFHFHPICVHHDGDKWKHIDFDLQKLADSFDLWQNEYQGNEANVMNNHDTPRLMSVWLDDEKYRVECAKLLITVFALLHGNLYIYQGDEIGMRNANCLDINKYVDVESHNKYRELTESGCSDAQAMAIISKTSRDNARIPMAWNSEINGGFSSATPWLSISTDYKTINAKADLSDKNGIYNYYKKIISYRRENYGIIKQKAIFSADGNIYTMKKKGLKVVANFSPKCLTYKKDDNPIFSNYEDYSEDLRPFEVLVYGE